MALGELPMVHEQPGLAIYRSEVNWEDVEEKKGEEGEELSICQIKRSCGTLRLPQRSGLLHGKLRQVQFHTNTITIGLHGSYTQEV